MAHKWLVMCHIPHVTSSPPLFEKAIQLSLPAALPGTSLSLLIQINTYNYPKFSISCHPFLLSAFSLIRSYKYKLCDCFILVTPVAQINSWQLQPVNREFHFIVTLLLFKNYAWDILWFFYRKFGILHALLKITSCKREKLEKIVTKREVILLLYQISQVKRFICFLFNFLALKRLCDYTTRIIKYTFHVAALRRK